MPKPFFNEELFQQLAAAGTGLSFPLSHYMPADPAQHQNFEGLRYLVEIAAANGSFLTIHLDEESAGLTLEQSLELAKLGGENVTFEI